MPNYVRNRVTVKGDPTDINCLLTKCETDQSKFSFEGIIPMPDYVYRGNLGLEETRLYPGDLNWYDWRINHWDTKWDAVEPTVTFDGKREATIRFDTAWSAPYPVYKEMARQYPMLDFYIEYADEDLGENCGIIENGRYFEAESPLEFAANLWGISEAELIEYGYIEEE